MLYYLFARFVLRGRPFVLAVLASLSASDAAGTAGSSSSLFFFRPRRDRVLAVPLMYYDVT